MSEDSTEVDSSILENVQLAIRRNIELAFVKNAKIEFKGDRSEPRILALSAHRFYVLTCSKNGCKVDFSMHILEIQRIESSKPLLLTLSIGDKSHYFRVSQPKDTTEIIAHIVTSLKSNFPCGSPDRLLRVVYGPPEEIDERQAQVTTLVNNLRNTEGDVETGPCGGFSKVYVSMCDFYGQQHLEEVVWDIDTIYLSLNTKELNIQDFDHLDQKDLVPIISTLEYNDWFTRISCDSFKLGSEVCDAILRVIKKSSTIEELVLDNISFGRDYCQKLALALTSNPKTSLHSLSLNGNSIEDRGVVHLAGIFSKLPHGLVSLSLADNGITSKGASSLGQALKSNKYNESSLQRLDLSKNPFKVDGVAGLCDFFAKPNTVTYLDLSATECPLDLLFGALIRGCLQQLASIHLAGNSFTTKKIKDAVVPPSFQQFFSSSQALKSLDVSECKLHGEAIGAILKGLNENNVITGVELNISKNELRASGAKAIAENIGKLKSVSRLDISDNGFEMDLVKILQKMALNKSIEYLNLGQNTKHSKSSTAVMEALVQLISENSHLESISLADSKLKDDIIPVLDTLGTNESLKELDISGNHMGDEGARVLAKALHINSKLRTLNWDKNGTTYRGFADIAAALECNHTLLSMPVPLHDAAQSLKPQTEQHLRKIEKLLLRNQSPHKVVTDQAYRLQQGLFLASTQQQMVDRLVVQLQDLIGDLRLSKDTDAKNEIQTAKHYIQDADKLKQLLLKFHLCTNDSDLEARFAELAAEFHKAAEDKMKSNMDKMIDCAKEVCPYITSTDEVRSRLEVIVQNKPQLSETFIEELILTQAAAGIANRLSEDKLTVASVMVDTTMEVVIHQLESSVNKLELLLRGHRNRMEEVEKEAEKSVDDDDVAAVARKARNRLSSSHLAAPVADVTDGGVRNYRRRPTFSKRPIHGKVTEEEEEKEKEDKEEVKPAKEVVDGKPSSPLLKTDFTVEEPKATVLTHLGKDRPRPQKRRPPTRPSNRPSVPNGATPNDEEVQENIEVFWEKTVEVPAVAVTPPSKKTSTSKAPPASTQTTTASRTPPPKPAPKPKPSPKTKESEENKKSGWIPKGGINIGIPGFLKKKNRDRSSTGPDTTEASTAWYTNNGDEKKTKAESLKEGRNRSASEKKPEVKIERASSDKKSDVTKERVPSEKKPEVSKERVPSEKKPEVTKERVPSEKKPESPKENVPSETQMEVSKDKTPPEKKPEVSGDKVPAEKPEEPPTENKKEEKPTKEKPGISRDRKPSDKKPEVSRPPIMGMKPFALPRDRATTDSGLRATAPQPRDRAGTSGETMKPTPQEPASATARKPPKFGVGIGGAAGGGLLAEMKLRQERAASLGRKNKVAEKPADTKPADESSKENESEVTKERLVKPSSFKRPRLPSGTPPKPAPRPPRKEPREEKKEENKEEKATEKKEERPEEKKEEQTKESKVDKPEEKKPDEKEAEKPIDKEEEKPEEKKAETPEEKKEEKKEEKVDEKDGKEAEKAKEEETRPKVGASENEKEAGEKVNQEAKEGEQEKPEQKKEVKTTDENDKKEETEKKETRKISEPAVGTKQGRSLDDLWVKHEPGKQALRPGGRSNSLKVQRTMSSENAPSVRSATLPKPWSPGQGPSSILTRKLSWELPKVGVDDAARGTKDREETIKEDSEEQNSQAERF